jgi:hypothetical protein
MSNFIIRFLILFLLVILQVSFFVALFSGLDVPIILVAYTIILTITEGFKKSLLWIIVAALVFDLLAFNLPGLSVIPLVLISYMASFISREIWLGGKTWVLTVAVLLAFVGNIFAYSYYYFAKLIFVQGNYFSWEKIYFGNLGHLFLSSIFSALVLVAFYFPLKKMENYLSYFEKRMIVKR